MKSLKPLCFSRPRKSTLVLFLAFSSAASALTPAPVNNQALQPPVSGMVNTPSNQALPSLPANIQTQQGTDAPQDSKFAKDMETIQKDIAMLEQEERKAKLKESLSKYRTNATKQNSSAIDATDTDTEIGIRAIYGVGRSYQAVIYYRGAELTVKRGTDINGRWKVISISESTVRIKNGDTEKVLSLSSTTQAAQPQQMNQAPMMQMPMMQAPMANQPQSPL
ncbi:MAG: type IV pilus biogenesis protein PilP [Methylobacter sp.]|jgi:type IV pilus biogenesis protein PilP